MNLSKNVKVVRVSNAVAAGTSEIDATAVDMAGYEGVMFVVAFGAIVAGAATSIKGQSGAASDGSDAADLAGTNITVADTEDNTVSVLDIYQPTDRYVRPVVLRATQNATVDSIVAVLYNGKRHADALDTAVKHSLFVQSPAKGTP